MINTAVLLRRATLLGGAAALSLLAMPASAVVINLYNAPGADAAAQGVHTVLNLVAEGRHAVSNAASFEYDVGQNTSGLFTTGHLTWTNGVAKSFTFTYNPGTTTATFQLGGSPVLNYQNAALGSGGVLDGLGFRIRSTAASGISFEDLLLDGEALPDFASANIGGAEWMVASGFADPLADGFILTGNVTLSWTGAAPTQSNLAFQIKGLDSPNEVPEPATLALLGAGLLGLGAVRRLRKA